MSDLLTTKPQSPKVSIDSILPKIAGTLAVERIVSLIGDSLRDTDISYEVDRLHVDKHTGDIRADVRMSIVATVTVGMIQPSRDEDYVKSA